MTTQQWDTGMYVTHVHGSAPVLCLQLEAAATARKQAALTVGKTEANTLSAPSLLQLLGRLKPTHLVHPPSCSYWED